VRGAPVPVVIVLLTLAVACTPQGDPSIGPEGFRDDFDREDLGDAWHDTGGNFRIIDGQLNVRGARNRPLWLRRRLPEDVRITFTARSESAAGDIKVEVFGDGNSRATSASYTATSYVVIFGGWNNSLNIIARRNEHAEAEPDENGDFRVVGARRRVEVGRVYRFRIERRGETLTAWVDDQELASLTDTAPLYGRGHDHFAFNNWEADLWFDDLVIEPL
jgi:hypothetical protein